MRRTFTVSCTFALLATAAWAQTPMPVLLKYPRFVAPLATAGTPGTGTPFAVLVGVYNRADTAFPYAPRLVTGTTSTGRQLFWIDSTSEAPAARNTWQGDGYAYANRPLLRSGGNAADTVRIWTAAKCVSNPVGPYEGDTISFRVRLKGGPTNYDSPRDTIRVMNMTATSGIGGWLGGHIYQSSGGPKLSNYVILAYRNDTIVGSGISEDNLINEAFPNDSGYFLIAVRAGTIDSLRVCARTNFTSTSMPWTVVSPPWTVNPGDTTWTDNPPIYPSITGITLTPQFPLIGEPILVSAQISVSSGSIVADSIRYAFNDTSAGYSRAYHDSAPGGTYWYTLSPLPSDTVVWYHIVAYSDLGLRTVSPAMACTIPPYHSIYQIQYNVGSDSSPDVNRYVQTAGIVTGVISQRKFFIGDAAGGPWHGLYCYQRGDTTVTPVHPGDSLMFLARVLEFSKVTELDYYRRLYNYGGGHRCDTTRLTLAGYKSAAESYEGVLLRFDTLHFVNPSGNFISNGTYLAYNAAGSDTATVFVTSGCVLIGTPVPQDWFNLVCNGYQYNATRELQPRVPSDIIPIRPDITAQAILAPLAPLAAGDTVHPEVLVKNLSLVNSSTNVPVTFDIGGAWTQTVTLGILAPGQESAVTFPRWTANPPGTFNMTAWVGYPFDPNRDNDTVGPVPIEVRAFDPGIVAIVAPTGVMDTGVAIAPSALLKNFGTISGTFTTWFFMDSAGQRFYTDQYIATLGAGETLTHGYLAWVKPHPTGSYAVRCSTWSALDVNPANNTAGETFTLVIIPAAPVLTSPADGSVTTTNPPLFDWEPSDGAIRYHIQVADNPLFNSPALDDSTIAGNSYLPAGGLPVGTYYWHVRATAGATWSEWAPAWSFSLTAPPAPVWTSMSPLPPGGKGKNVKDGGALAYAEGKADSNFVYAFKGNGTYEFYRYHTTGNTWLARESIPALNRLSKKKAVKKGSSLAVVRRKMGGSPPEWQTAVYATKGNNTLDFWQYDPNGGGWTQKTDVPTGTKNVKEGAGAVHVKIHYPGPDADTNYVYFLKGSGTFEFHRYNTEVDAWTTMTPAPGGLSTKPYKNGSSICYDGSDTIYCLKGSYNEFAAYSVSGNNWVTKDPLPLIAPPGTKKKKVKDGSGMAFAGGTVYALKGGGTNEFWTFNTTDDKWYTATELTAGVKKVKAGGALTAAGDVNALFAFRGNNTLEFYKFGPVVFSAFSAPNTPKSVMSAGVEVVSRYKLQVTPNPFVRVANVSYAVPKSGNVSLSLYDVTGKLVTTLANGYTTAGNHSALVNAEKLASGIYLLKFESDNYTTTSKLTIE